MSIWPTSSCFKTARADYEHLFSSFSIIRRRIAWLVGDWIGELDEETGAARVQVYGLLSHLLGENSSTDLAIRLTAARSLAKCCDAWHFKLEEFAPYLAPSIEAILALLREVDQAESQTRLSKTLNALIDRAGSQVVPFAEPLMHTLGHLWSVATESQLRISILVTFTALVNALNEHCQPLQVPGAAIIVQSVDLTSEAHVYLLEDGLDLWHALLKRSSMLSNEMMALLPVLVQHLAAGTDVLPRCLQILESYLLIDAPAVLQVCCSDLFAVIENLLGDLKLEAVKAILHALDTILRKTPCHAWIGALDQTNAIGKLLAPIINHDQIQIVTKCEYAGLVCYRKSICTDSSSRCRLVNAGPDCGGWSGRVHPAGSVVGGQAQPPARRGSHRHHQRVDRAGKPQRWRLVILARHWLFFLTNVDCAG